MLLNIIYVFKFSSKEYNLLRRRLVKKLSYFTVNLGLKINIVSGIYKNITILIS